MPHGGNSRSTYICNGTALEQVHQENAKTTVNGKSRKTVHNFNSAKHMFVNRSENKMKPLKRSLHKLEVLNCIHIIQMHDCLANKMTELRLFARNNKPAVVGITEVKPKNFRYDLRDAEIALEGYDMFGCTCNLHNKIGRGVAL